MASVDKTLEKLARAQAAADRKRAVADAAQARVKKRVNAVNRQVRSQEIKAGGKFARDTGLLTLAQLDADAFRGILIAVGDPEELERFRSLARGEKVPATRLPEAAE